jgi:hypothetical protein
MAMNNMMLAQVCVRVFILCDRFRRWDDKNRGCFYSFFYFNFSFFFFNFSSLFVCLFFVCLYVRRDYCYYYYDHITKTVFSLIVSPPLFIVVALACLPADRNTTAHEGHEGRQPKLLLVLLSAAPPLLPGEHVVVDVFRRRRRRDGRCSL